MSIVDERVRVLSLDDVGSDPTEEGSLNRNDGGAVPDAFIFIDGQARSITRPPRAAPSTLSPRGTDTEGTSTDYARADHVHRIETHRQYAENNSRATRTGGYSTRISITTPALPAGTYRIGWHAIMDSEGTGRVRVRRDGSTITELRFKPTDSSDDDRQFAGFQHVTFAASQSSTFELQWRGVGGSNTGIDDARLEFWRVDD